ncbi:hypothetical protein [Rubinisphaera italica]|uniref:Uncharacterized protein n=1 Tax=Rubinisphaera italica TaxID=2527969 RepID=A0A5C5XDW4_9PLAN|nr:hypothetical protein [Rubinisphaera italica]TWT60315.1 hypothetical protein Pan54_10290 [Rubinisphaera italica]
MTASASHLDLYSPSSSKNAVLLRIRWCLVLGIVCAAAFAGCQITDFEGTSQQGKSLLNPITPGMETVQLDIVYVERDAEDPLLSKFVWEEIDQVGTVDLETRSRLRDQGFRVGLVGLTPPRTLQRLLGLKNEITDSAGTSRHTDLIGRQTFLPSGGTTSIQTSMPVPEMKVLLTGSKEPIVLSDAHGVLHTEVERLQDGWIKLHLTPEIHYGSSQLRPVASGNQFQYQGGQQIEQLRDLSFTVTMNVGEMLILSADENAEDQIAGKFFINQNGQRDRRYMVAIRLTDMKKIQPLYEN